MGDAQPLGMALAFGGPYLGFMTCKKDMARKLPGRIVGETIDLEGKRGYVLTLQAREQHIRREKASSSICSNQALCALTASVYMAAMGPQGLYEVASQCFDKAHYAAEKISKIPGFDLEFKGEFFHEFVTKSPVCRIELNEALAKEGNARPAAGGIQRRALPALVRYREKHKRRNRRALRGSREDGAQMSGYELIFEKSRSGRRCAELPQSGVPSKMASLGKQLRKDLPKLPEIAEVDLVRHYTNLSRRAYGVDNGFYPLGSCTMKYNPKLNEDMAALGGFTGVHPLQNAQSVQGSLELMWTLGEYLKEITGMDDITLQPAAGAHGEWTGLMLIRAFHLSRNDSARTKVIVPDSAHGTNPASAAMAGFTIVSVPSGADGCVDVAELKKVVGADTAALMLTNPNTLGLFEKHIEEITEIIHAAGGLVYYDGANLNAVMGKVRPGDMGFDVMHLNLHKTFSTPHGGGGPGSGPVACKACLSPFLPKPVVKNEGGRFILEDDRPQSIGRGKAVLGQLPCRGKGRLLILSRRAGRALPRFRNPQCSTQTTCSKSLKKYSAPITTPPACTSLFSRWKN